MVNIFQIIKHCMYLSCTHSPCPVPLKQYKCCYICCSIWKGYFCKFAKCHLQPIYDALKAPPLSPCPTYFLYLGAFLCLTISYEASALATSHSFKMRCAGCTRRARPEGKQTLTSVSMCIVQKVSSQFDTHLFNQLKLCSSTCGNSGST